jgi:hypothetical protein
MALKGSGSVSLLADDEDWTSDAFAFDAIDTLMNVEGVTFAVVGAQNVTVELYAEDMMTLIDSQVRILINSKLMLRGKGFRLTVSGRSQFYL